MATVSNYALRLSASLMAELRKIAKEDGTTINQFINVAVAEKIAALRTADYFRARAARADRAAFERVLAKAGSEPPVPGDEMPDRRMRNPKPAAKPHLRAEEAGGTGYEAPRGRTKRRRRPVG